MLFVGEIRYQQAQAAICIRIKWPPEGLPLPTVCSLQISLAKGRIHYLPTHELFIIANGINAEHLSTASLELNDLFNANVTSAWNFCIAEIFGLIKPQPSKLQMLLFFVVHTEEEFIIASLEALPDHTWSHGYLEILPVHLLIRRVRVD